MARWPTATRERLAFGKIDIDAAAEADEAEALAGLQALALVHEPHDAARHEAGDLDDADALAVGHFEGQRLALIVVARLVEIGVEELSRHIGDAGDAAVDRARFTWTSKTFMKIEMRGAALAPQIELRRRHHLGDGAHPSIGRRDRPGPARSGVTRSGSRKK